MAKISIGKSVIPKKDLQKLVQTDFEEFGTTQVEEVPMSVDEFFTEYERLFLEIPKVGDKSHQYLVTRSQSLLEVEEDLSVIQPLMDEIANLRAQNLNLQEQVFTLTRKQANNAV